MSEIEKKKKMLLWFGVVTVTIFIIGLWFLNMRTLVYDVTKKKSAEGDIYRSMEQEVSQIFSSFSIQDSIDNAIATTTPTSSENSEAVEANLKKSLSVIAAGAVTTTATTTASSSAR